VEEQKLQVFKNKVSRKILGHERGGRGGEGRKFVVYERKSREKNCLRGRGMTAQMKRRKQGDRIRGGGGGGEGGGKRKKKNKKKKGEKKRRGERGGGEGEME